MELAPCKSVVVRLWMEIVWRTRTAVSQSRTSSLFVRNATSGENRSPSQVGQRQSGDVEAIFRFYFAIVVGQLMLEGNASNVIFLVSMVSTTLNYTPRTHHLSYYHFALASCRETFAATS
jgi:hypothetical protein